MSKKPKQGVLVATSDMMTYLSIEPALRKAGFIVSHAPNTVAAIKQITAEPPDFLLLDSRLQEMGGMHLCNYIRVELHLPETRIILLSDNPDPAEKIRALNMGAHDYMLHPVDIDELLHKIAALQHRRRVDRLQHILRVGNIELVPEQHGVYVDGVEVHLTETEYRLLQELMEVEGRVLTREVLLERIWGHHRASNLESRALDVHMSRLRQKLGSSGDAIITVRKVGYRINVAPGWRNH